MVFDLTLLSVYISSSLHHPLTHSSLCLFFFLLLPTRPSTYSPCYQPPPSLPLSHFPLLIHLSDFTRTQGDPGQTSCRGNRQSRNILYFFFFFFYRERRGWRASERQLMYLTETDREDEVRFQGDEQSALLFAYMLLCVWVSVSKNMAESEL